MGSTSRGPAALVGVGDERTQARADVLDARRRQTRPGAVDEFLGRRRRPCRDGKFAQRGENPAADDRGLALPVAEGPTGEVLEIGVGQRGDGPRLLRTGADWGSGERGGSETLDAACLRRSARRSARDQRRVRQRRALPDRDLRPTARHVRGPWDEEDPRPRQRVDGDTGRRVNDIAW